MIKLIEEKIEITPIPDNSNDESDIEMNNVEIPEEAIINGIETECNNVIQNIWNLISQLNGLMASLDFDYKKSNRDDIKDILDSMVSDFTIDIGMMYKVIGILNEKTANLLDAGKEKAEEIIQSETIEDTSAEIVDTDSETESDEADKTEEE